MKTGATMAAAVLAAAIACLAPGHSAEASDDATVVVELFTSQGCSSCPPADAFLRELAERPGIIALTFPVDYWDYLGWKDTLASPANTARQKNYAARHGDRQVYTPQMVLDGQIDVVGSSRSGVERAISRLRSTKSGRWVAVDLVAEGDSLLVTAAGHASETEQSATLWLALFTAEAKVEIRRGENHDREIAYRNVVRQMMPIGKWTGEPLSIDLPKLDLMNQGYDGCAAILQTNGTGPIIGAALIDDWIDD